MMDLKALTDEQLHHSTQRQAEKVRFETTLLLHHLCEVRRRRLFAKYGCDSMFSYCVKVLKMSDAQAGRSLNAAMALQDFPEVEEKINSGALCFTTLSQAQGFFKREAKVEHVIPSEEKKEILQQLEHQPTRQVEQILLKHSAQPEKVVIERVRPVNESIHEMKLAIDRETLADLDRLKKIWSHEMPGASYSDLIKKAARLCREKCDPIFKAQRAKLRKDKREGTGAGTGAAVEVGVGVEDSTSRPVENAGPTAVQTPPITPAPESASVESKEPSDENRKVSTDGGAGVRADQVGQPHLAQAGIVQSAVAQPTPVRGDADHRAQAQRRITRYIPASVRHAVWLRDGGRCTYADPLTGEMCESRHRVQPDHIIPFAMGGEHAVENLRLRCAAHNQWHAFQSYGPEVMNRYVRS